jgi:large subunit ribosomal protein L23
MNLNRYDIIKRPISTEKTNLQKEALNQVTFEVDRRANRVQIEKHVEEIFNVRVASVRTMQVKGKKKQRGRITGRRKNWKKAIVKLMPGERIEFFEGV